MTLLPLLLSLLILAALSGNTVAQCQCSCPRPPPPVPLTMPMPMPAPPVYTLPAFPCPYSQPQMPNYLPQYGVPMTPPLQYGLPLPTPCCNSPPIILPVPVHPPDPGDGNCPEVNDTVEHHHHHAPPPDHHNHYPPPYPYPPHYPYPPYPHPPAPTHSHPPICVQSVYVGKKEEEEKEVEVKIEKEKKCDDEDDEDDDDKHRRRRRRRKRRRRRRGRRRPRPTPHYDPHGYEPHPGYENYNYFDGLSEDDDDYTFGWDQDFACSMCESCDRLTDTGMGPLGMGTPNSKIVFIEG